MNKGSATVTHEPGPVTRGDRAIRALHALVEAGTPIAEDGGSDEQVGAFQEVFAEACFVLHDLDPENKFR